MILQGHVWDTSNFTSKESCDTGQGCCQGDQHPQLPLHHPGRAGYPVNQTLWVTLSIRRGEAIYRHIDWVHPETDKSNPCFPLASLSSRGWVVTLSHLTVKSVYIYIIAYLQMLHHQREVTVDWPGDGSLGDWQVISNQRPASSFSYNSYIQ